MPIILNWNSIYFMLKVELDLEKEKLFSQTLAYTIQHSMYDYD